MRDDYKMKGHTVRIEIEVEKDVYEKLKSMESYAKLTVSELANTALKRFISSHSDFLPKDAVKKS